MRKKIVAVIGLITICILMEIFIIMGILVVNLLDNIDSNQKEVDSYQDRMMPDQREMSPPNQDGSDQREMSPPNQDGSDQREMSPPNQDGSDQWKMPSPNQDGSDQREMSPPDQDGSDQDSTSGAAKPE